MSRSDENASLSEVLSVISVTPPGEHRWSSVTEWWAVVDTGGIVAYFAREDDAFAFRLMLINAMLNPTISKR